jgi:PhnB protein
MRLTPKLMFEGNCLEAFKFYEKALGAKIEFQMTWGDSPMSDKVSSDWKEKIIHATVSLAAGQSMSGGDAPPGQFERPQGFCLSLDTTDDAEAKKFFSVLSEKGSIQMALEETFWATSFGMVTDQFGIPWMINCGKPHKT